MSPGYAQPRERRPPFEGYETILVLLIVGCAWLALYVTKERYHFIDRQLLEFVGYFVIALAAVCWPVYRLLTARSRREKQWPHPPLAVSAKKDERVTRQAWSQNAVVFGYDVHGKPWLWPDQVRVMQGIVLGMTGTGKTTLLANIVTQDLYRVIGPPDDQHRIPMLILDGKGDTELLDSLLPHIHHAGRLADLRVISPSRPEISVRYNPLHCNDEDYMPVVNMVFGSFNLHREFFKEHQLHYLANIVRVLVYTGLKFNFYDVLVMAMDQQVLREQVAKSALQLEHSKNISTQQRLNFEMSVKSLYQSFEDRERVPKIQGLLNQCMTFLDDELSVITGPYEELVSLDEAIEQELILYVTLNVNKNAEPVTALGKMLLQNLQLVIGKRYESEAHRRRANRPILSVVLDEFAPFGYRNFPQILQTARGTNTAFLFSMQSLSQLMHVGRGFKEDIASAPNTTVTMRTRDEETASYFLKASAEHRVTRRNLSMEKGKFFGFESYEETGRAVDVETRETRSLDEHIKNLPKGQMEILMTDDTRGTLHAHLHVRPPTDVTIPNFRPELYPRLKQSRATSVGANLRFKSPAFAEMRYARRGH